MTKLSDFTTIKKPTWCPGCGNYGILTALKGALIELNIEPENIVITFGIGCSGNFHNLVNTYTFHSLHGRTLPIATGVKLANNKLTVLAVAGDGDGYGIGTCHFIHSMRRNLDITFMVHNNKVYGLTTGQASPTSDKGFSTKSTPTGVIELSINPIAQAIVSGATYIARGFAGDPKHLKKLIVDGVKHHGFSLIDVLQPCVTFNHVNTYQWYNDRIYKLEEDKNYNSEDKMQAFIKAQEWGDKIPIGLFYKEIRPTYEDEIPQIAEIPLVKQSIDKVDISELMQELI